MLLSSYAVFGLTYILPTQLGAHLEYYFLELVPVTLTLTLCVIFTSHFMHYFERRNQKRAQSEHEGGRDISELTNESMRRNGGTTSTFLSRISDPLNTIVLVLVMLGCKFGIASETVTMAVIYDSYRTSVTFFYARA